MHFSLLPAFTPVIIATVNVLSVFVIITYEIQFTILGCQTEVLS